MWWLVTVEEILAMIEELRHDVISTEIRARIFAAHYQNKKQIDPDTANKIGMLLDSASVEVTTSQQTMEQLKDFLSVAEAVLRGEPYFNDIPLSP
jgi:hypothetical protein